MVKMLVTIIGGSEDECGERCGTDWSSAEVIASVRQSIKERFGEGVELEYIDLAESKAGQCEIMDRYRMPALLVNGKLRISGHFDVRQLFDVIETELEVNREH